MKLVCAAVRGAPTARISLANAFYARGVRAERSGVTRRTSDGCAHKSRDEFLLERDTGNLDGVHTRVKKKRKCNPSDTGWRGGAAGARCKKHSTWAGFGWRAGRTRTHFLQCDQCVRGGWRSLIIPHVSVTSQSDMSFNECLINEFLL